MNAKVGHSGCVRVVRSVRATVLRATARWSVHDWRPGIELGVELAFYKGWGFRLRGGRGLSFGLGGGLGLGLGHGNVLKWRVG